MTLIISAFIEVELSISWPLNQHIFLFLLTMDMKYFGPFHIYIRPLTGASFGDFLVWFWLASEEPIVQVCEIFAVI